LKTSFQRIRKLKKPSVDGLLSFVAGTGLLHDPELGVIQRSKVLPSVVFFNFLLLLKTSFQRIRKLKKPSVDGLLSFVAGTGFEPMTFGL
jgi:hypothetical protein